MPEPVNYDLAIRILQEEGITLADPTPINVHAQFTQWLSNNNKIKAIKHLRALTGYSLKEAKDAIDEIAQNNRLAGPAPGEFKASILPQPHPVIRTAILDTITLSDLNQMEFLGLRLAAALKDLPMSREDILIDAGRILSDGLVYPVMTKIKEALATRRDTDDDIPF